MKKYKTFVVLRVIWRDVVLVNVLLVFFLFSAHSQEKIQTESTFLDSLVLFEEVDVHPLFDKCKEEKSNCEKQNCVDVFILTFIKDELNKILKKQNQYMTIALRAVLSFEIGMDGKVSNVKIDGKDAKDSMFIGNIIRGLPKMTPAIHEGEIVKVLYTVPIVFGNWPHVKRELQERSVFVMKDKGQNGLTRMRERNVVYPGCNEKKSNEKLRECMSNKVKNFVDNTFDESLFERIGLTGNNKVYVRFQVSKCGNVINVQARGPHPELEKEAVRVIKLLPRMQPGLQEDEPVNVMYSLPINISERPREINKL